MGRKALKWPQYNISAEIQREAAKYEPLDAIATGGNMDFIHRDLGKGPDGEIREAILTGASSGSPESVDEERVVVNLYLDGDWSRALMLPFATAREALRMMGLMEWTW